MLAGCESPTNGSNGGNGTNALPAATATTAAGAQKFFADGYGVVYFAGDLVLGTGGEDSLTIPDGKTLILADVADLNGRAVAASGKGSITVNGTLSVAATGVVKIDGTLTGDGTFMRAQGSKFVYSATGSYGDGSFIGNGSTAIYEVTGSALFTEIAGATDGVPGVRRGWTHQISGGTVKINQFASYINTADCDHLTVLLGGTLNLNTPAEHAEQGLKITDGGVLTVASLDQLTGTGWLALNIAATGDLSVLGTGERTAQVIVGDTTYSNKTYRGPIATFNPAGE
jgi:hypothetical protein